MGEDLETKVKWGAVWKEHGKPLEFYKKRYAGLTRGELKGEDEGLYQRLRCDGLLEGVPLGKRGRHSKFGDDPVAYYKEHHDELTRGQLQKENKSLYERLRRDGLLEHVPMSKSRFGDDPVAYYKEHYAGLSRGQLQKEDRSLYECLRRDGLLEGVPVIRKTMNFGDDPVAYYKKHHAGVTRTQLKKKASGLYQRLWRRGLLEHVPLKYPKKK